MHIWLGKNLFAFISHEATAVALGGALGANGRYWLGRWISSQPWGSHFPWGTVLINISGSFLLAALNVLFLEKFPPPQKWWLLMMGTGFCGGFTTFSTFEYETFRLIEDGKWWLALVNVLASVLAGFLAVVLGIWVFRNSIPDPP